ncbi:hypothetical protein R1sor_025930 [Riccia sorocarpa]|uniref:Peptidase S1 domain-containing protein n=1 Tax=Riccia sorocarpa TaxID=122646 RepID=A0ABD3GCR0_9MARC
MAVQRKGKIETAEFSRESVVQIRTVLLLTFASSHATYNYGSPPPHPRPDDDAPVLLKDLEHKKSLKAEAELPNVMIEITRFWHGSTNLSSKLQDVEGATVFEVPFSLKRFDPPELAFDALDKKKVQRVKRTEVTKVLKGFRPLHLPVNFNPAGRVKGTDVPISEGGNRAVNVFTPDDRYIFQDTAFPWSTTGKVQTASKGCTGTMVGRRLMLTASHCIQWNKTGPIGWVKFTPAYYKGAAPFGTAWGERILYWNRAPGPNLTNFETAFDYVVVVLDRNIGNLTGYTGFRTYSPSWNNGHYWQQIGYPSDLSNGEAPAFSGNGSITSVDAYLTKGFHIGYVLGNFIDIVKGHSGGPYWGWWKNEPWPRVVATCSSESFKPKKDKSGDNNAGGGPALYSLISYARKNYS